MKVPRKSIGFGICLALTALFIPARAEAVGMVEGGDVLLADQPSVTGGSYWLTASGSPVSYGFQAFHGYTGITEGQMVNGMGYVSCFGAPGALSQTSSSDGTSTYSGSLYCQWQVPDEPPPPVPPTQGIIPNSYYETVELTVGPTTWSLVGWEGWPGVPYVVNESCNGVLDSVDPVSASAPGYTALDGSCTLTD